MGGALRVRLGSHISSTQDAGFATLGSTEGHKVECAILPEKRKVGGSTPPLTTRKHKRFCSANSGNVTAWIALLPPLRRPFLTARARCRPKLSACRMHGGMVAARVVWLSSLAAVYVAPGRLDVGGGI